MIRILPFVILFLISTKSSSQGWQRLYGGIEGEECAELINISDGGFLAVGTTYSFGTDGDMYVVKTDSLGQLLWQRNIGNGGVEKALGAAEGPGGEIYVAGRTSANGEDAFLAKLSADGTLLWTKTYGGPLTDYSIGVVMAGNDIVLAGTTTSYGIQNQPDIFLLKADSAGNQIWYKTYGSLVTETASCITKVHDGGFLVSGSYKTASVNAAYAVRMEADGDSIWKKIYLIWGSTYGEYSSCIELKGDSSFIMAGLGGSSYGTYYASRMGLDGNVINHFTQSGYSRYNTDVYPTSDGGYVANGYPFIKFSALNIPEWETSSLNGSAVVQTNDGGYCTGGIGLSINTSPGYYIDNDLEMKRTNAAGTPIMNYQFPITVSGASPFCEGDSMILSVPSVYDEYIWYQYVNSQYYEDIPGSNNDTLVVDTIGSYVCMVKIADQTFASAPANMSYRIIPYTQLNYTGTVNVCLVDSAVTFSTAQIPATGYQWYRNGSPVQGGTYYNYIPQVSGNYYVTTTNACGTATSDVIILNTNSPPPLTVISPDTTYLEFVLPQGVNCWHDTLSVPFSADHSYKWYHNGTLLPDTDYRLFVTQTGLYSARISNSCQSTTTVPAYVLSDTVDYQLSVSGPLSGCGIEQTTLSVNNCTGCTYKWYRNSVQFTAGGYSVSPSAAGYYYCEITRNCSGNNITIKTDSIHHSYIKHTRKSINFEGLFPTFCGDSLELSIYYSFNTGYQWFLDSIPIAGADSNVFYATESGIYYVEEYFPACDTVRSYNRFIRDGLPEGNIIAEDTKICMFDNRELELISNDPLYGNYGTIQWRSNGLAIANATNLSLHVTQPGIYDCVIANICGSVITNSIAMVLDTATIAITSNSNNFCEGDTYQVAATTGQGYTYEWYFNGSLLPGITTSVCTGSQAGNYYVKVSDSSCNFSSFAFTMVQQDMEARSILSVEYPGICGNDSVHLIADPRYDLEYEWYHDNNIIPGQVFHDMDATQAGEYKIIFTDSMGCDFTSYPISIADNTFTNFAIYTATQTNVMCNGDSIELFAGATGVSYQWHHNLNPIPGADSYSYKTVVPGLYTVIVTTASGCTGTSTIPVVADQIMTPPLISPATCSFSNGSITINTPGNYIWSTGDITNSIMNLVAGDYTVTITNLLHCQTSLTITVPDTSQLIPVLSGDTLLCPGESAVLSVNNNPAFSSYAWSDGSTGNSITVNNAGQYWVQVTDSTGTCTGTDTIMVLINAQAPLSLSANGSLAICSGDSVELVAAPLTTSYKWLKNDLVIGGAVQPAFYAKETGSYRCIGINSFGCRDTSSAVRVRVVCIPPGPVHSRNAYKNSETLSVTAYPNPSSGDFNIHVSCTEGTEIKYCIYNVTGEVIYKSISADADFIINSSSLTAGIYSLELICGEMKKHVRLAKIL